MKRKQVEMTYLLCSQALRMDHCYSQLVLRECNLASKATRARIAHDQPFRVPFGNAESFPGTPTEYDIPVMLCRLQHH
jgi:hypothetical protein